MEVVSSDDDQVWVHDYHLMLLPTFMREAIQRHQVRFFYTVRFLRVKSLKRHRRAI